MKGLSRITLDPAVMGGKACIRGLRVTVELEEAVLLSSSPKAFRTSTVFR